MVNEFGFRIHHNFSLKEHKPQIKEGCMVVLLHSNSELLAKI